jgi:hypothetical protein
MPARNAALELFEPVFVIGGLNPIARLLVAGQAYSLLLQVELHDHLLRMADAVTIKEII